jgi:crotonobetainyl-CoA:carnitine CoA-transferase CaiB-like acyl-CoA transferase
MSNKPQPLDGIRVIDMTSLGMGPMAAQILGDHGADVIKLESPEGDIFRHVLPQRSHGMSHAFIQFNRNKRSMALDLKTKDGMEAMRKLIGTADVVLSNMRPAAMARLGLTVDALRAMKPDLIYCACYGYSERGPYAGRPAADDTIQAMSGLTGLQRMATGALQYVPSVVADKAVGQAVANAILAAIIHRMKTGEGQAIEVPMFETMVSFVMPEHVSGRTFDPPIGEAGYARIITAQRRPYPTLDGYLCVMPYTTAQWLRFLRLIGRDDLADDPEIADMGGRSRRFDELYGVIAQAMPTRSTDAWIADLVKHDILFGKVNSPEDLMSDEHLEAVNMFPVVDHPTEGRLRLLGFPVSFSATPQRLRHLPPTIGQHTRPLLQELGYHDDEIDAMRGAGAVSGV